MADCDGSRGRGLTPAGGKSINPAVRLKPLIALSAAAWLACGLAFGQPASQSLLAEAEVTAEPMPPEVLASAVAAVGKLGDEVVLGHYKVAVDRMNPQWKERTAKRMGGKDVLEKQLAGVAAQMVQQGISMIYCKPVGKPLSYEVGPDKRVVKENGVDVEKLMYGKWLVLVPTETRFRIFPQGAKSAMVISSTSFQVAICDKGKTDWTFIDGANLNVGDLRGLFSTLPKNMELPPVKKHEVRD